MTTRERYRATRRAKSAGGAVVWGVAFAMLFAMNLAFYPKATDWTDKLATLACCIVGIFATASNLGDAARYALEPIEEDE